MTDPVLQMHLLAFMLVALWLIVFWKLFRKVIPIKSPPDPEKIIDYNRVQRVSSIFWIIFSLFGMMIIVYAILPNLHFLFLPLDTFHHPLINSIGLLILKVAIVWIVVAQLTIDKEVYKYSRDIESLSAMELLRYSEKMLSSGMLVLFIGVFVTITNIVGIILGLVAFIFFVKTFHQHPHRSI